MATLYRIKYLIHENGATYSGVRVVDEPIAEYIITIRKQYADATNVYLELLEEFERSDSVEEAGVIIMGMGSGVVISGSLIVNGLPIRKQP